MPTRIVAFSANTRRPSRTRTLVEAVLRDLERQRSIEASLFDLVDAGPGIGVFDREALPLPAARIVEAIERADALIVGTPVYQGSYSGLFKHLFDFVRPEAMAGKPVVLTATGGGMRHALVVEHSLRPLFGFFASATVPTGIYAGDDVIVDGAIVDAATRARISTAATELGLLLDAGGRRIPLPIAIAR